MKKSLILAFLVFCCVQITYSQNSKLSTENDSLKFFVDQISEMIRDTSLSTIKKYDGYTVELNQDHQLKVELLLPQDGPVTFFYKNNTLEIKGVGNIKWDMTYLLLGSGTINFNNAGFVDMNNLKNKKVNIKEGEVNCLVQFSINGKLFTFKNGNLTFSDYDNPGIYSEGSKFEFEGSTFVYNSGKWVKLQ